MYIYVGVHVQAHDAENAMPPVTTQIPQSYDLLSYRCLPVTLTVLGLQVTSFQQFVAQIFGRIELQSGRSGELQNNTRKLGLSPGQEIWQLCTYAQLIHYI